MNKYTGLSDFEINKRVAYLFLDEGYYEINSYRQEVMYFRSGSGKGLYRDYDPCNNPIDAWQLILEAKLSIHPDFNNDCESWIVRNVHIPMVNEANLARAISIAYLLYKDAENEG